jgi:site-specific recombinase XerD
VDKPRKIPRNRDQPEVADSLILELVEHLTLERNRSRLTTSAYVRDIQEFGAFLQELPTDVSPMGREYAELAKVSTSDVRRYVIWLAGLKKKGGKPRYDTRTICRKLSSIKALYRFMRYAGRRPDDPASAVPGPRITSKEIEHLEQSDVRRLLRSALAGRSEWQLLRDRAIMELLYACGIRRAEVSTISLKDVRLKERTVKIHGKGRKERTVPFNHAAADAVRAYLAVRPRTNDDALFVGRGGKRLTPKHIWRIFRDIYKVSGVEFHATPHTLRHSFATHLVENGADIETVREFLGHEDLTTTGIYLKLAMEHKRRTYDQAHPRDRMDD